MRKESRKGATAVEFLMVGMTVALPLGLSIFYIAQILWVWHSAVEMTRDGARYAATHCYQNGANVVAYMRQNVPVMPDRDQFRQGTVEFVVTYFGRGQESNDLSEFSCDSECSLGCVPDVVKVQITGYEYRTFLTYFGIPPAVLPDFQSTIPMEGAGCDADTGVCIP